MFQLRYIRAVIDIHGNQIVVYNFHATFPPFSIPFSYDDVFLRQNILDMAAIVEAEELPVLLLCDCNTTPRTPQYARLDEILEDTFQAQGWGFGLTHPSPEYGRFRRVRIDYIWHNEDFAALEAKVWSESGSSDHYPVWGRLILKANEPS